MKGVFRAISTPSWCFGDARLREFDLAAENVSL